MSKVNVATEWLGSCAGCHISVLDMDEAILDILSKINIVYSPVLADVKEVPKATVGIITGAIRNEENIERAKKMREKCDIIIALGACACSGGIPGMGNLHSKEELLEEAYINAVSNDNKKIPSDVPKLTDEIKALDEVIKVDVKLPGCPTPANLIVEALTALLEGKKFELSKKAVCDECKREIEGKDITELKKAYEKSDPKKCLLEQGFLCLGPATRAGCESACPEAGIGCRGCFGPGENVKDQGAKMLSALASMLEMLKKKPEVVESYEEILEKDKDKGIVGDTVGSLYRFTLAKSIINKRLKDGKNNNN